ncbi:MAG: family 43 glycosylhydrolase [Sphingomonas sp.]
MKRPVGIALASLTAMIAAGNGRAEQTTYANPIDIDYRYNFEQLNERISYRTGADPAVVRFKGAFYMFETLADGYWRSTDLIHWKFIKPSRWPFHSVVAPAAWADGDRRLILMPATMEPEAILESTAPETGKLDFLTRLTPTLPDAVPAGQSPDAFSSKIPPGPWDPALFKDDDGQWYLYWDSNAFFPIYGIKVAFHDNGTMTYEGHPVPMFTLHPDIHGWERFGQDHDGKNAAGQDMPPFIEGAWMTKVNGRYYLQYAAPGTEFNVYGNGTYVSDKPLGPFTYAPWNPVSYKPGGFVEGAGHGSTFEDNHGNWWNTGTPWVGNNWAFERRIAMFPTQFTADGEMITSTRFGDFPHYVPDHKIDNLEDTFTGWMLLSYRAKATASSTLGDFAADRVTDENPRTFWVAAKNEPGQTLTLDLGSVDTLRAVQVDYADYKSNRFDGDAPDIYTEFKLQYSTDGSHWLPLAATGPDRRDRPNAYFELPRPVRARYVRYVHGHVGAATLAISDLRVFGNADGAAPAQPDDVVANRDADRRDAQVTWNKVAGAIGYNVRWGLTPDRLTQTYQIFADDLPAGPTGKRDLRSLNVEPNYYVAVEAFNATGVSRLSKVVPMKLAVGDPSRR